MSYRISNTDPASMSTDGLLSELEGFVELAAEVADRMSVVLKELRRRREKHPFFYHPVLGFFTEIADGKLDSEAAILLGNRSLIRAVLPLPKSKQKDIAKGAEVVVALSIDGAVDRPLKDAMPIRRMDASTLRRAFGPSGIRSFEEQSRMLRKEGSVTREGSIKVLHDEHMLQVGMVKIKPEDLSAPLRYLGYKLELVRNDHGAIGGNGGEKAIHHESPTR